MKKAARGRLFAESERPITWRRWREQQRQVRQVRQQRQVRKQLQQQEQLRELQQEQLRVPEQRREPERPVQLLLPSCHKRPGLRLQSGSPIRAISSFSSFLLWVEQFPEIVSAPDWPLMTELQGLELLLLNLKL
jgi:hypothetical protein